MKLITNFEKKIESDIIACAQIAGLEYEIHQDAYRLDNGALMENHSALWCSEGQTCAIERFFTCHSMLIDKLKSRYRNAGVPEELLRHKTLYIGCEKEYFPEYVVQIREYCKKNQQPIQSLG